jgi:tripartite-type tricarboxylate transporter receptor subunit TctC
MKTAGWHWNAKHHWRKSMALKTVILSLCLLAPLAQAAENYPSKPIRLMASEPGGAGDFAARLVGPSLNSSLGQQVIIDNRVNGMISGNVLAVSAPDGYTLLLVASNLWLQPFLRNDIKWDPVKDFAPITLATTSPLIVIINAAVPVNNVKELMALAKAKPGVLNYGSGASGSSSHLGPELFKAMTGLNIVRIAYKGAGAALNGLIGGEVQMMIASAGSSMAHVKAGRLKALAVTSAKPSALFPGMLTVAESGVPGYEFEQTLGLIGPAKTPKSIIATLNRQFVSALNQADVKKKLFDSGVEVAGSTPEQFGDLIKSDMKRLGPVIKNAGIHEGST